MEQKASQELIYAQTHEPLLVAMGGIAPAEGDVAIGESNQSAVGDGDTMGVCAEITQHMFRSAEGMLGIDDPVVAEHVGLFDMEAVYDVLPIILEVMLRRIVFLETIKGESDCAGHREHL